MRCNCGIHPSLLADQHLIVEARELGMVAGSLKYNGYVVVGAIPKTLKLGKGHLNFFKDKLAYLHVRWQEVVAECTRRGFNIQKPFYDLTTFPQQFVNNWTPTLDDSMVLRGRISEKLHMKPDWYRYNGEYIGAQNVDAFCKKMFDSPVFYV
jgi:deoxyribonuclease (pyrimidine dimer)